MTNCMTIIKKINQNYFIQNNLKSCGCSGWYTEAHAISFLSIKNQEGINLNEVIVTANLE